jgi:trehalose-6-phosphate synthase
MSSGGLVSALSGCKKTMQFTWIGWPGKEVSAVAILPPAWSLADSLLTRIDPRSR